MNDRGLLRYSRHILLDEFGIEAQEKLATSHALVIGAGGLGSAALMYLASAGVAKITVADGDKVDLTNLQRQIIHREASVGVNKAESARDAMLAINADININVVDARLDDASLGQHVLDANVVLDCTDNFATRHAINRVCVKYKRPLVSGAGIRFDGQITSFDLRDSASACYHCLFPDQLNGEEERCAVMGVFAPLVGIIGAMQAAEALRLLTGVGIALIGRLQMLDARNMTWQTVKYKRDPACPVCGSAAQAREYRNKENTYEAV
jgi:molybdopterin/thiamine biosynthesis adenylyltransferase